MSSAEDDEVFFWPLRGAAILENHWNSNSTASFKASQAALHARYFCLRFLCIRPFLHIATGQFFMKVGASTAAAADASNAASSTSRMHFLHKM
jgi:hypothetical protein